MTFTSCEAVLGLTAKVRLSIEVPTVVSNSSVTTLSPTLAVIAVGKTVSTLTVISRFTLFFKE